VDSVRERPDLFPSRERSDKVLPRLLTVAPCSTLRAAKDVLLRQLFSGIVVDCTATRMSFTAIYSVAVVFSALFFVGWYLLSRSKKSPPATLEEPPRWHKWFDDPV